MEPPEFGLGGKPLVFCMFPVGTKLVPNATLSGMDCLRSSGAQRRSGPAPELDGGSCFRSGRYSRGLYCGLRRHSRLFAGLFNGIRNGGLANSQGLRDIGRLWRFQILLKLAILVEGVADTLLDNVIGGCARLSMGAKEGDILID
jgi:hypothetical protein